MNKSIFLKICSIALVMVMCLLVVTGCNETPGTSSVGGTSSVNSRPGGTSSDATSSDITSDITSSDNNSSGSGDLTSAPDNTVSDTIITTTQTVPFDASKNPLKKGINFGQLNFGNPIGYDSYMFQGKYYDMIREKGFVNLDFAGNLGHSIVRKKEDRIYIEKGNSSRLGDVAYFTFEPHISIPGSKYGYKKENIYYFKDGKIEEL